MTWVDEVWKWRERAEKAEKISAAAEKWFNHYINEEPPRLYQTALQLTLLEEILKGQGPKENTK